MGQAKGLANMQEEVIEIEDDECHTNTVSITSSSSTSSSGQVSGSSPGPLAASSKRKAKKDDLRKVSKMLKKDIKRMPNIAEELAKNRNQVKGSSPSPVHMMSSSPMVPQQSQGSAADNSLNDSKSSSEKTENGPRKDCSIKTEQIKISSLLSPNEEIQSSDKMSLHPQTVLGQQPHSPSQKGLGVPKVILPTQKLGSNTPEVPDLPEDSGFLVARLSSPVNLPETMTNTLKKTASTVATATGSAAIPKSTGLGNNSAGSTSKTAAIKTKKTHSVSSVSSKSKTGGNSKSSNDPKKKSNPKVMKKESSAPPQPGNTTTDKQSISLNEKKEIKKQSPKLPTAKKESSTSAGKSTESKKKGPVKKESSTTAKPKTPKKLAIAPQIKSPSLLEVFERGKATKEAEDPVVIVDVPLYSTKNSDYLDENGQVTFNYYKLMQDKISSRNNVSLTDEKIAKRNLLGQLNRSTSHIESIEVNEGEDTVEDDDDGEDEDEEEVDEEKTLASPKKRPHSNKGKSLIGKYDTEDPFIDDSELLWEEQRAATKDGFFVYFGPLIEKGHYASLERADGTMKRGGVKNK